MQINAYLSATALAADVSSISSQTAGDDPMKFIILTLTAATLILIAPTVLAQGVFW
jgi:hypothetical protein